MTPNSDYKVQKERKSRKTLRLSDYDYSQPGAYFVTIVTQARKCLFGEIHNKEMSLNNPGNMVQDWWLELLNKYPELSLSEYIIMPNHFHGIIEIALNVGADLRVCPDDEIDKGKRSMGAHTGAPLPQNGSLPDIVRWFKTMTTNGYIRGVKLHGWPPFDGKLWQRNYYEHVIRDERDYEAIVDYIQTNPDNWERDEEYALKPYDFE